MKKNLAMKRFSILMVTIIMVTALCPTALAAEVLGSGTIPGSSLTWSLDDSGVLTISGAGAMPSFTANNLTETGYNQPWADYNSYITSIVVESGVTAVGDNAFCELTYATAATLPAGVKTIGSSAFSGCVALETVNLPEGLERIGPFAFYNCDALATIILPSTLTTIGNSVFYDCDALTNITFPASVQDIGRYAFYDCNKLAQVTLTEGVETIGSNAFSNCTSLTSITIPRSVWYIDASAFSGCSELADIRFEGAAPGIVNTAFVGVTANAQYPQNYSTWGISKRRQYGGTLNWVGYTAAQSEPALLAGGAVPDSDLNWELAYDGTLTISGIGAMPRIVPAPWFPYERIIKKLVVKQGQATKFNCILCCIYSPSHCIGNTLRLLVNFF